ncbi:MULTISPECIES: PaaX family transcriptional regulator C-terminal domain-containing protein [unclassified Microbacterium]|uniref:PaaX family transcriptional regulator n=1 Tax=unclassified Microbacterium TaxID=2609290 RepID=UPI0037461622
MTTITQTRARDADPTPTRNPRQLLLALLGEQLDFGVRGPLRAGVYLDVLEGAGVAGPTARATLDRMVLRGFLTRARVGRGVEYGLTDHGREVLREASDRVHSEHPFSPQGLGWTLVTFSVPEGQRTLRHRLRAALTWEGFAPVRDGLWVAPGEVDLAGALEPLRDELPESSVVAFRARDLPEFPLTGSVRSAWDLAALRGEHERFLDAWAEPPAASGSAMSTLTLLVSDWLALLRADPRLPEPFLDEDWPAARSIAVYRARRAELLPDAVTAFADLARR